MKTILDMIQEQGTFIQATCNGNKVCGQCKIKCQQRLSVSHEEKQLLSQWEIENGIRLACCHPYDETNDFTIIDETMAIADELSLTKTHHFIQQGNGLIVDLGTTTIVMKWIDLFHNQVLKTESFKNPQASYGGDVISRITYAKKNPGILNRLLIEAIENKLLEAKIKINKMIVCGNTVMTNFFLNQDVTSLGNVPFHIPIQTMQCIKASQIFPNITEDFELVTFNHISAYVGGDIVAGILSLDIDQRPERCMLLDLGTNGEIAVGNYEKILTTSTAAGPAFEGVGISCGGPSIAGAITAVEINNDHVTYQTIGHQTPRCICGSGLISIIAQLRQNNIINEIGKFIHGQSEFVICENIKITQKDIEIFQLAKAAIQAGVHVLLQEVGDIDKIFISGGFGSHISVDDLIILKIIPEKYRHHIYLIKNSALNGAYSLLMEKDELRLNKIAAKTVNINLASYPDFEDNLIEGLYL